MKHLFRLKGTQKSALWNMGQKLCRVLQLFFYHYHDYQIYYNVNEISFCWPIFGYNYMYIVHTWDTQDIMSLFYQSLRLVFAHCEWYSYVPSFQQHLNTYAINLQTADLWLCRTMLVLGRFGTLGTWWSPGKLLEEVTRKFYKVRGLQFVSWSHKYSDAVGWW